MTSLLNRVTAAVARSSRVRIQTSGAEGAQAYTRQAIRHLASEGKALRLPAATGEAVDAWFAETQLELMVSLGDTPGDNASLSAVREAHEAWRAGGLCIPGPIFHVWRFGGPLALFYAERRRHPSPATVAFDCDGVLYDFNGTLRDWLITRGWDRNHLPDPTVYSLADAWGLHDEHLHAEIAAAVTAGALWNIGRPLYDGISAAQSLALQGHSIIVNTARRIRGLEDESRAATLVWLRQHGVHPDGLHLADPRNPLDKLVIDFDILLDDHASNVSAALKHGREALLIDRPWNGREEHVPRATFADAIRVIDRQRMPMPVA